MPIVEGAVKKKCLFIHDGKRGIIRCDEDSLEGQNYCHKHISSTKKKGASSYKALQKSLPDGLQSQYEAFIKDKDVLDLRPMLGMLKTFLFGLVSELEEAQDKEDKVMDTNFIKKVKAISSEIRQCAKTVTEIEINKEAVIDIHQARKFVSELQGVISEEIDDPIVKRKIFSRLNNAKFGSKKRTVKAGRVF